MINEPVTSSDLKSADAAICASPAFLYAITLIPAAAACSLVIYDNATTNSGTVVMEITGVANGASQTISFNSPVFCLKGIYADVTGTGANYLVHFQKTV